MDKPSKSDASKGNDAEYTLPLNPAKERSILALFDEDDRYTDEALALNNSVVSILMPIVQEVLRNGFSIREIIHALHLAVTDIELDVILEITPFRKDHN